MVVVAVAASTGAAAAAVAAAASSQQQARTQLEGNWESKAQEQEHGQSVGRSTQPQQQQGKKRERGEWN